MSKRQWATSLPAKSRCVAFLWHLAASLVVFLAIFAVIYLQWFPWGLSSASGGLQGLTMVALVDLTLGPLLTFVVYDVAKSRRHLFRDIGVIASLQLSCLVVGVVMVYQVRPIAVVHVYDTFYVLSRPNFDSLDMDAAVLERFPGAYPKIVYVKGEKNPVAFATKSILDQLNRATPAHLNPDLYQKMPRGSDLLADILQGGTVESASSCRRQNIVSAYVSGSICFDMETFRFSDFLVGDSISELDDITLKVGP